MFEDTPVVIKGAGDVATGVAVRLFRSGFPIVMTEIPKPTAVRRTVALSEAVYVGEVMVEGVAARYVSSAEQVLLTLAEGKVPVIVDPMADIVQRWKPKVVIDAIMAKRNMGTKTADASVVVGLGPGFTAGVDVHAVIETNRGHRLGRVIWDGQAEPNTGQPGDVNGFGVERVLRAPAAGELSARHAIHDIVEQGELIGCVDGCSVIAPFSGVLRGLISQNVTLHKGMKIGDIDPRAEPEHCFLVSEKALAIGGGVLEAVLTLLKRQSAARL